MHLCVFAYCVLLALVVQSQYVLRKLMDSKFLPIPPQPLSFDHTLVFPCLSLPVHKAVEYRTSNQKTLKATASFAFV